MKTLNEYIQNDYLVYVRCNTFNHSHYIRAALDSFAKQNTTFPFVCIVTDDCSTDGAQDIIKEWIKKECDQSSMDVFDLELTNIYVAKHLKNINCTFVFYFLKKNMYYDVRRGELFEPWIEHSKYEAICEGDDYWTDPNKLQEQIDFLEKHVNYSATSSNSLILRSSINNMTPFDTSKSRDYFRMKDILVKRKFHTASVVYRISAMRSCPFYKLGAWDTFMWCCLLSQGPIHYESKATCIYRKQFQGVTESIRSIKWIEIISNWADIIIDCFVPHYVQRKYVVRSVTKEIVEIFFIKTIRQNHEYRRKLILLYKHNFSFWNIGYDLMVLLKQCAKKLLGRKNPDCNYYQ